jgi:GT2 family glycosyltransferase
MGHARPRPEKGDRGKNAEPQARLAALNKRIVERKLNYEKGRLHSHQRLSLGVVVPCHNNSWQLSGLLESLRCQTVKPEMVIVVDDNSNPSEKVKLRYLCRNCRAVYTKLPDPRTRLEALGRRSHARNVGTKCLETDIILYLDGDMLLGPRYVEEIKCYHAALQRIYIRGQRYSISAAQQTKGMELCLAKVKEQQTQRETLCTYITPPPDFVERKAYQAVYYDKWEWCASNNLSVRNEHVSQIGYWDENFVGWGEEDIDFSFRLFRLGLTPIHLASGNAASYHLEHHVDHETNTLTFKKNGGYLMSKFPELAEYRREAYARYYVNIDDLLQ